MQNLTLNTNPFINKNKKTQACTYHLDFSSINNANKLKGNIHYF
jgi:hypothetical protein